MRQGGGRWLTRVKAMVVVVLALGGCSLFSDSKSPTTSTTVSTTTTAPATTTTQPPGNAGVDVLKPVLDDLVDEGARLRDELLFNKGAAILDTDSPQRAAFIDQYSPGNPWPEELLAELAEPLSRQRYLEPRPGESRASWAWVVEVFPRGDGGTFNEVEFSMCEERKGIVVDEAGTKISEPEGVVATRLEARRYEGTWKINSRVEVLDPIICAGGHPT